MTNEERGGDSIWGSEINVKRRESRSVLRHCVQVLGPFGQGGWQTLKDL